MSLFSGRRLSTFAVLSVGVITASLTVVPSAIASASTATKTMQTVSFSSLAPSPAAVGTSYAPTATASSGLPVTVKRGTSSTGCTVTSGLVTFTGPGTCVLAASQAGNATYRPATPVTQLVQVVKQTQNITFTSLPPLPVSVGSTYTPHATSSAHLAVKIRRDDASTGCLVTSGVVTFNGAGTCLVDADQAGNAKVSPAAQVQQIIPVLKQAQSVSFTSSAPPSGGLVGGTYVPAAVATSGLAVGLRVDVLSTGCTLSAGLVAFTATGTCVLDADQAGNAKFAPAARVRQLIQVWKNAQTVSFTSTAPAPGIVATTYTPTAVATSDLAALVTLDPSSTGCALDAGTVTFTAAGVCVIDADQAGDDTYAPAVQVEQSIEVDQVLQSIQFSSAPPAPGVAGSGYLPAATASSGLAVTISLDAASTGCTLDTGTVTFTTNGVCVIDADQPGDATYSAAPQAQQLIDVVQQTQTVSFTSTPPIAALVGGSYSPTATSTSGLDAAFSLDSTSTGCTVTDGAVAFTAPGTCVLDADQGGDATYAAAPTTMQSFTVFADPTAVDDSASVNKESGPTVIDVLTNDTDPGGATETITAVSQPAHGTAAITTDGQAVTYQPQADYCNTGDNPTGPDTFSYTINGESSATVSVTVNPFNGAPIAGSTAVLMLTNYPDAPTVQTIDPNNFKNNFLDDSVPDQLDASDFIDPASCLPAGSTLTNRWLVTAPNIGVVSDPGITGATTPILSMNANSMIDDEAGKTTISVQVTSTNSGLATTYTFGVVVLSGLPESVYEECKTAPPGTIGCPTPTP